jgi:hypothetical protein
MRRIEVVAVGKRDVAGKLNLVASLGPIAVCLIAVCMATYVRVHLGRWPVPSDEPNTMVFTTLTWLLVAAIWFAWLSFPAWLLTTPWLLLQRRFRLGITRIALYLLPTAVFILTLNRDTPFSNWLLD